MKAVSGSYGGFFDRSGTCIIGVLVAMKSVWPSGGDCMTADAAIAPSAPVRFSTTTGWPSDWPSSCASVRDTRSVEPPAGKWMMRRIGLVGYWAAVLPAARSRARSRIFFIRAV